MKTHYSEVDLLEMHYLKPCMNTAMLEHVEACPECTAKLKRLEQKLRSAPCDTPGRPESFWQRQRLMILQRIEQNGPRHAVIARSLRVAAATVLAFFLGGVVVYRALEPRVDAPAQTKSATATVAETTISTNEDAPLLRDPWQSDELNNFHSVVKWESWIETKDGGQL